MYLYLSKYLRTSYKLFKVLVQSKLIVEVRSNVPANCLLRAFMRKKSKFV